MLQICLKSQQSKEAIPTKNPEGLKSRSPYKKHGIDIHAFQEFAEFSLFAEKREKKKRKTSHKDNKVGNSNVRIFFLLNYPM